MSFFNNRKQRDLINGTCSEWKKVLSRVPQGSVLGPILLVIYINDIIDNLNSQAYVFEDDMKLYRINSDTDYNVLQSDINKVDEWTRLWLLKLNRDKCKCMILSINKKVNNRKYFLNTSLDVNELQKVYEVKDIGDSSLKFELHVAEKIKKANRMIGLIQRYFNYLDKSTFLTLYKALLRPHLEYAQCIWSPYKRNDPIY